MKDLAGKPAVVTGAASGLGRAMAERFAAEGMVVAVADIRLEEARRVAQEIADAGGRAIPMEVDVSNRDSVEALAERIDRDLGGARVLVNNAGVISPSPLLAPEELGWRWIVEVNLFGIVYMVQTFVPRMLKRRQPSHVVNVASLAGVISGGGLVGNRVRVGDGVQSTPKVIHGYFATSTRWWVSQKP